MSLLRRMGRASWRRVSTFVVLSVLAVVNVGCGASSTSTFTGPADEVRAATVANLGRILVDGQGFTLYVLAADKASGHSTCIDICADEWPPVTLPPGTTMPIVGPGIKPSLRGLTSRGQGVEQVTYDGWPLYLWPNDTAPGMATGQGVEDETGQWYVLGTNGTVVR